MAGKDVLGLQAHQVVEPPVAVLVGGEPVSVPEPGPLQLVADAAGVGEQGLVHPAHEVFAERGLRLVREVVAGPFQHQPPNGHQLFQVVVGEVEMVRDPGSQAGVGLEEDIHPVLVARENHDELVPLVLHHLKQDLDRLLAEILAVIGLVERGSLVDEQHPAHRAVKHPPGLRRRLAHILADEVVAHGVHKLSLLQVAELVQQAGHEQPDRRLSGAWGAGEAHMQIGPGRHQAEPLPHPVDEKERTDLLHLLLHRYQADQLAVERGEHVVDGRGLALGGEGDHRVRRKLGAPARGLAALAGIGAGRPPDRGQLSQSLLRRRGRADDANRWRGGIQSHRRASPARPVRLIVRTLAGNPAHQEVRRPRHERPGDEDCTDRKDHAATVPFTIGLLIRPS